MKSTGIRWFDRVRMRWQSLRHRGQLEEDLAEELRFHQERLIEGYRADGLDELEARRRARLELGGPAQISEEVRDQRGWRILDQLVRDSRLAFRGFRSRPGFTITAVVTIAIGMGVNTTVYTALRAVLSRPLPVADAETLRNIHLILEHSSNRMSFGSSTFSSFLEFQAIRSGSATADVAGVSEAEVSWRNLAGGPVRAQLVSDNLLPMIGARPSLGRLLHPRGNGPARIGAGRGIESSLLGAPPRLGSPGRGVARPDQPDSVHHHRGGRSRLPRPADSGGGHLDPAHDAGPDPAGRVAGGQPERGLDSTLRAGPGRFVRRGGTGRNAGARFAGGGRVGYRRQGRLPRLFPRPFSIFPRSVGSRCQC